MEILNIGLLWWLTLLIIPLFIHLLSKKKQSVTKIGTVRFIVPSETMSSKSIYFTQWLLFLLRCLIITTLVLIIAKLINTDKKSETLTLIEKSIASILEDQSLFDESKINEEDKVFFSLTDKNSPPNEFIDYWSLIYYLNSSGIQSTVYAENKISGFKGTEVKTNSNITWKPVIRKEPLIVKDTLDLETGLQEIQYINDGQSMQHSVSNIGRTSQIDTIFFKIASSIKSNKQKEAFYDIITALDEQLPFSTSINEGSRIDWFINIDTSVLVSGASNLNYLQNDGPLKFEKIDDQHYNLSGSMELKNIISSPFIDIWANKIVEQYLALDEKDIRQDFNLPNPTENMLNSNYAASGKPIKTPLWILLFLLIVLERITFHNYKT